MKKVLSIYWKIRIMMFSVMRARDLHLGDTVYYQDAKWTLVQGVCQPRWTLSGSDGTRIDALESEFRAPFRENAIKRVRSSYRFYMGYWHSIWVNEGIKPWMRGLRIWGNKP